jgi:hypothetical protein
MEKPTVNQLIVMRLADMHTRHPQQDDTKVCSKCGQQVGIYPSGQRALAEDSDLEILCMKCVPANDLGAYLNSPAPGAIEEALDLMFDKRKK